MAQDRKRIFGLVGPSGVGKGFVKEVIRKSSPETFSEPVVATTRPKRSLDSPDRLAGLSREQFFSLVEDGEILFPHQPFGENTDWYGFMASSFSEGKPVITEVHVDNVRFFREKFTDGLVLIALMAESEYLAANMRQRGDLNHEINQRLIAATDEMTTIRWLHQQGLINYVIAVNFDNRETLAGLVLELLSKQI